MDTSNFFCVLLTYFAALVIVRVSGIEGSCSTDTCKNNGICELSINNDSINNDINCICKSPFKGPRCEIDLCYQCGENEICEVAEDEVKCKFPSTGDFNNKDPCDPNPCNNNGTCMVVNDIVDCMCKDPFEGLRCEKHPCEPNPCKNNGTCKVVDNTPVCKCEESFRGDRCESILDRCAPTLCQNGGSCRTEDGQCDCVAPFTGDNCEIKSTTVSDEGTSSLKSSPEVTATDLVSLYSSVSTISEPTTASDTSIEVSTTEAILNTNVSFSTYSDKSINGSHDPSSPLTTTTNPKLSSEDSGRTNAPATKDIYPNRTTLKVSDESTTDYSVKLSTSGPRSSYATTSKDFSPNINLSTTEVLDMNTSEVNATEVSEVNSTEVSEVNSTEILKVNSTEVLEQNATDISVKLSTSDPKSTKAFTNTEVSATYILDRNTKITVSKSSEEGSFTETSRLGKTTRRATTTIDPEYFETITTLDPHLEASTKEESNTITITTVTDDDDVKKKEITKKQSSPKTVAYVCGATGAGLGLIFIIAGIVHVSKRLNTKKRTQIFQNADSTSIGSANSVSNLV